MGSSLYGRVYEEIEAFNKAFAEKAAARVAPKQGMQLLQEVSSVWTTYCARLRLVENVLMFLDRCFILLKPELSSVHELGVSMFRNYFLQIGGLFEGVKANLLQSILGLRQGRALGDVALQRNLVEMLVDIGLFSSFEPTLLDETTKQYVGAIVSDDFKSYQHIQMIAFILLFEEQLVASLNFPKDTQAKLVRISERLSLLDHLETIVATGLPVLVEATWTGARLAVVEPPMNDFGALQHGGDELFNLNLLICLAKRANGSDVVKATWSRFIKAHGASLLASGKEETLIEGLLLFKTRLEAVVERAFARDPLIENALKESFETFINAKQSKLADLLARYFDQLLREGRTTASPERLGDAQLAEIIGQVVVIFKFLQSKEAVEAAYKKYLAGRLLQNRSISMQLEKDVVMRLKAECGASFTSRLEGMFKDVEGTPELTRLFREAVPLKGRIEFNATVVSSGIWPVPDEAAVELPAEIAQAQAAFDTYYDSKHTGRRLKWSQSMGYCVVKARFPQGEKELQVSVPQAMVLQCFNDREQASFDDIQAATGLEPAQLRPVLESMSTGHHQILVAGGAGPKAADMYAFNAAFTSRLARIRLSSYAQAQVADPKAVAVHQLDDSFPQIDAAIVRTIKAARKMARTELVQRVAALVAALSIPVAEVDKRIDVLVGREFIAADPEDAASLVYLP